MEFMEAYRRIYAAWLGKCAGVRLGSPIEGWTYEEIRNTYAPVTGYTTDYGQYAADDDLNGPLFFAKVMEEKGISEVTPADMGDNMLNVVAPLHGFYWWGGPGTATEHTAYVNLQKGIKAPLSGSAQINGKTIAEQIGGQIFSDCWGFLSLGDPQEAADLAAKMSSVTHDLDGIEGGRFVAAAIALAWTHRDAEEIIRLSRTYLDPAGTYKALIDEFLDFHDHHPDDAQACLDYIHANHGYDKYPGACHILPNTAIMLYGMLYGKNDFNETMRLIAEAGCDTDCNLGNVGAVMGMMLGPEVIEEKWITPFNDILLFSSAIGALNIRTISETARYFTGLAFRLHGLPVQKTAPFCLPYATNGFCAESDADRAVHLLVRNDALRIVIDRLLENTSFRLYRKAYFRPEDVYDVRYEPQFAAVIEPGDTIVYTVRCSEQLPLTFTPYIRDRSGEVHTGRTSGTGQLEMTVPGCAVPVLEAGLIVEGSAYIARTQFELTDYRILKHPDVRIDFRDTVTEDWGTDIGLVHRYGLSGLLIHEGNAYRGDNGIVLDAHSAVNFSGPDILYTDVCLRAESTGTFDLFLSWSFTGVRRHSGVRIKDCEVYAYSMRDDLYTESLLGSVSPHNGQVDIDWTRGTDVMIVCGRTFPLPDDRKERGAISVRNAADTAVCLNMCGYKGKGL